MKISVNWMKQLGGQGLDVPINDLLGRIGSQLGEVDGVENLGEKYQGVVVAKVISCEDHPNADRLHVCTIDDGGNTPDVKRDEHGHVQVVCGAPNVREGLTVAWLPPGSTVPESVGKEPFVLEARELRGVVSNGMLASPKELALGDSHEGILEIDEPTAKPGDAFATVYGLDDYIIDIENKMFTHRPDCFGQLGVARELAGIADKQFTSPEWYTNQPEFAAGDGLALEVSNEAGGLVPRLMTLTLEGVTVKPSPIWLQTYLQRVGVKSINNVVDATNYIMLLTAQPTHAYDYDKLRGHKLVARSARAGEEATLLNRKTYKLDAADIVIADGEGVIGLAGIMGGGDSEVSDTTTNIVLECANFDMYSVRRSSMRHGLFTDALTRFNKGQSPLQNGYVLKKLLDLIQELAGGEVAGSVVDISDAKDRQSVHAPVQVTAEFINARLGFELSAQDTKKLLENVECKVEMNSDELTVTAPFWRTDIETREDVVEEVGRLYGFDKLPLVLPERSMQPAQKDSLLELKSTIRKQLVSAGANEVLTYSFVHANLLDKVGQDTSKAFSLSNALSPDLQYYRLSLTPSLLANVHHNIKAGYGEFALFELGKTHYVGEMDKAEPAIPNEDNHLAFVIAYADKTAPEGAAYYQALRYLNAVVEKDSLQLVSLKDFAIDTDGWAKQLCSAYEPGRSAVIVRDNQVFGIVGEFKTNVRRALKLPNYTAGFELHLDILTQPAISYQPLHKFPTVRQDITLKVKAEQSFAALRTAVDKALGAHAPDDTHIQLDDVGVYQGEDDSSHKNVTFRIHITGLNRTLTDAEVNTTVAAMADALKSAGAERV